MTKKHIQRLQLTVLPRHLDTIQSLKWELDTNSQVIMRLLDAIHLGNIDVSAILCPDFSKRHTQNTHQTSDTIPPLTTNASTTQTIDTPKAHDTDLVLGAHATPEEWRHMIDTIDD